MTLAQVAAELGIARATVYRWADEGRLHTYTHPLYPRGRLVKRSELEAMMKAEAQRIERQAWVERELAKAPPPTPEQAARIARLLMMYLDTDPPSDGDA